MRLAELDYQIRNDLEGMLGEEDPRTVNLLRGSQENGVKSLVNDHSANWWLIDSGASVTVIAKRFLDSFSLVSRRLSPSERYSAANDTPVRCLNESR